MTGTAIPDAPQTGREQHEEQKWSLSDPSSVRRLAVLRALKLGDLLLAIPALRALRRRFAQAEITLIGLPWASEFAARYSEYVDRFVEFAGYPGIREAETAPLDEMERFLAEQRAYEYDLVIQMHGSGQVSNLCALAFHGRETAGYYEERGSARVLSPYATPRLTYAEPYPHDEPEVIRNLGLARMLGCDWLDPSLDFPLTEADHAEAQALLGEFAADDRPLVGIHAGASIPARRWPVERFATLADHLAQEWDARIILTGGPDEIAIAQEVAQRMETAGQTPPLLVAGKTSLGGLAALIARCALFVANDTGPAHLAEAVGTPSVTLFGPASVRRWAPLDQARHPIAHVAMPCSPCGYAICPIEHPCMQRIEVERVTTLADRLLGEQGRQRRPHTAMLPAPQTSEGGAPCDGSTS